MPQKRINLANVFDTVAQSLEENQQALNQMDTYNRDHGTNMVKTFKTVSTAMQEKKKSSNSAKLAYAAKALAASTTSGSGQLYAQNLAKAARQFKGKTIDEKGALDLLQTLIGGAAPSAPSSGSGDMLGALLGGMAGTSAPNQASSQPNDMLGALLGGMAGASTPAQEPSQPGDMLGALLGGMPGAAPAQGQSSSGDMLGALLGGMTGGSSGSSAQSSGSGIDLQDILSAAAAFMQAKQQGQGNLPAILHALAAGSGVGSSSSHRQESTALLIQSFLQALSK